MAGEPSPDHLLFLDQIEDEIGSAHLVPVCAYREAVGASSSGKTVLVCCFAAPDDPVAVAAFARPGDDAIVFVAVTEVSDGRLFETAVSDDVAALDVPPYVDRCVAPPGTPLRELLRLHHARLPPLPFRLALSAPRSPEAVMEFLTTGARRRGAYRESVGWITEDELLRLAGPGFERRARRIYREIERLRRPHRRH